MKLWRLKARRWHYFRRQRVPIINISMKKWIFKIICTGNFRPYFILMLTSSSSYSNISKYWWQLIEDLGRFPFNFALGISSIFVWMLVWISEIQQFPRFLATFPGTDFCTICLWFQLFESFAWMENAPYLFFWKCLLTLHASPKCPLLRCMW